MGFNSKFAFGIAWKFRLTCVGLAFNFGKLMFDGFSVSVDGLHGVGGNLRPWPRR